jgi:hypothetical protein
MIMGFVVLCERKKLDHFRNREGYVGGIFLSKPDKAFGISIDGIPKDVSTIYFEYADLFYNFVMNNIEKFCKYELVACEEQNGDLITGNHILTQRGMKYLKSGDLNIASHFLWRAVVLGRYTRNQEELLESEGAYNVLLPNEYVKKGNELLLLGKDSDAAYCFRRALLIRADHLEAKKGIDTAICNIMNSGESQARDSEMTGTTGTGNGRSLIAGFTRVFDRETDYSKISLSDLQDITQAQFDTACKTLKTANNIVEKRDCFIRMRSLSDKTAKPDAYWKHKSVDAILNPTFDTINHLRLYSNIFTGNKLSFILDPSCSRPPETEFERYLELISDIPEELIARPPRMLGEVGWEVDGNIFNADVVAYQERLTLLYKSGLINMLKQRENVKILDIGSGYGGLAYFIKRALPKSSIYVCDIPESLVFAAIYLPLVMPEVEHSIYDGEDSSLLKGNHGFIYVLNYLFQDLGKLSFDLVINTLSFAEMSKDQVSEYAAGIAQMIGDVGFLFEQNQDKRVKVEDILSSFFTKRTFSERGTQGPANVWKN